ncbi:glycosyltransferase family 2 protein [Salinimonas sediminis]|uniref:glycosyltransferase family 2 protein n=1 Tax=Salinimonas sediminis TaxID=2303538 RepID=UPI0014757FF9|nr:glycosyltransferase family 2 protein [Salinimonas sediminis]
MSENLKATTHKFLRGIVELAGAKYKHLQDKLTVKEIKIKLVAVARDESAYLPEWISHHLHFGFDEIEIHINRTSDNTLAIIKRYASLENVNIIDADDFFKDYPGNPQVGTYKKAFATAAKDGFSHLCFLDIDEFWVPKDLVTSVKQCLIEFSLPDVVSFEWCNKYEPDNLFGPAVERSFQVERVPQVKSIIDARAPSYRVNPHTIVNKYLTYKLADGTRFTHPTEGFSRVGEDQLNKPIKPYFILHRYYRSSKEYVSLLGKGRPNFPDQGVTQVKSNRRGYLIGSDVETVTFDSTAYENYRNAVDQSINKYTDQAELAHSRKTVLARYHRVLSIIEKSDNSQAPVLRKVLKNVNDEATLNAYRLFQARL